MPKTRGLRAALSPAFMDGIFISVGHREKYSSELVGGHEPEGPETKRFKSLTTETEKI